MDEHAEGSQRGMKTHRAVGREQVRVESGKREYRYAWQAALSVIMLAMAITLGAIAVRLQHADREVAALFVVTIVLALGSAGLLTLALFALRDSTRRTREARLVPGRLLASDLATEAPLLEDPEWNLRGRPDYILQTRSGQVPVEVKTGRTPARPYRSHQLQVACYLRLLEAGGAVPEYGLLSYPEGVFRVAWTPELRGELKQTLERIRAAAAVNRADRDHDQEARCRGCARRGSCEQKLA